MGAARRLEPERVMTLGEYSSVVVSISGGKDSQTILGVVVGRLPSEV
jgi:predicted phosphoadenosine phosphosulfate sulfurtransferase